MVNVYLTGDWREPPITLAKKIEEAGHKIVFKWWEPEERKKCGANLSVMMEYIQNCDVVVFDHHPIVNTKNYHAGSYMACAFALAYGKDMIILSPEKITEGHPMEGRKLYTSMLETWRYNTTDQVLNKLRDLHS